MNTDIGADHLTKSLYDSPIKKHFTESVVTQLMSEPHSLFRPIATFTKSDLVNYDQQYNHKSAYTFSIDDLSSPFNDLNDDLISRTGHEEFTNVNYAADFNELNITQCDRFIYNFDFDTNEIDEKNELRPIGPHHHRE